MLTKKRKVIYSLLAATLLTTSVGHAESFNSQDKKCDSRYNNYGRGYTIDCNSNSNYNNNYSNVPQNTVVDNYPVFTWEVVNKSSRRPNKPVVTIPENPTTKPGTVVDTSKPTRPVVSVPDTVTKPDNTVETKPTTPTVPNKPVETPTSTPAVSGLSAVEMEVVRLVNVERQKEGLAPFTASSELSNVARKKSEDMATNNYFGHTSPTYGSSSNMMKTFGIKFNMTGENIAKGQLSAQSVVKGWMNSPGHRDNIMNPRFNTIGVGFYQSGNGANHWTQMFTN